MLSQLTREGAKDPNKTTAKSSEVSSCKLPFIRVTLLVKKTNTCKDLMMVAGAFFYLPEALFLQAEKFDKFAA